ncbi:hypothetical protein CMQ_1907 [Grosmannia clavigera kw1407]|uniref:SPIN90/Ldb17 leucine-rich domain-containing protein n=1 Tax=Grosmannia clavigera (strain kw1407 / UAMH 11150) TaxID=655863 RepID=F0XNE9_GROCL|nr:uncharacterized protein CMQ_1907 [Grosmannia clavigera kw1407]EFX00826.1 hypothetical protein CMQ_1907 [Grosmannia clavigera kw1407]
MTQFEGQPKELDAGDSLPSREQFWEELNYALSTPCASYELIDNALRAWLELVSACRDRYLEEEEDLARCSQKLLTSTIFEAHGAYVRTQIIYSLLQEDEARSLHVIANFLLLDGRTHEDVFQEMINAGCFTRLVELIKTSPDDDRRLHRLLLELMYEMSRAERVRTTDLLHVDDAFIGCLFQMIEDLADDFDDPYHYPVIRVLLVLNEQYMVAATTAATTAAVDLVLPVAPLTNRVIKVLSLHGPLYRTFGENIILLLNRETETSLQLLILKLMYLLFTTKPTYEYFYTNDLRVLLDVIIRNLLDLPDELTTLRHTYLRVLYPLLAHTQLQQAPHYKRDEILRVLAILSGSGNAHFAPADETTLRLVDRVSKVEWLATTLLPSAPASPSSPTNTVDTIDTTDTTATSSTAATVNSIGTADIFDTIDTDTDTSDAGSISTDSTASVSKTASNAGPSVDNGSQMINKLLGISLSHEESCGSVVNVASVKEKPGVKTPSRKADMPQTGQYGNSNGTTEQSHSGEQPEETTLHAQRGHTPQARPPPPRTASRNLPRAPPDTSPKTTSISQEQQSLSGNGHQDHKRRQRRALPAVPRHRHGVLMKPTGDLTPEAASDGSNSMSAPSVSTTGTTLTSGHGGIKKLAPKAPPKAPPPRRIGRLRQASVSTVSLQSTIDAVVESSSSL